MTTTDATRQALERASAPKDVATIYDLLERQRPEIEKALPTILDAERFTRLVLTELRRSPKLLECKPESLLAAMMLSAQLGLEPGPLGLVYLIPFKAEVTFIIGYKGMIALAQRSGQLKDIVARTVYEGDQFSYSYGIRDHLTHVPALPAERGERRCWYAVARLVGGGNVMHVMHPDEVEERRKRSPAGRRNEGPWATDYDAMARKTVIRSMAPFLPLAGSFGRALQVDEARIASVSLEHLDELEAGEA
jgi:recombination protein RecT